MNIGIYISIHPPWLSLTGKHTLQPSHILLFYLVQFSRSVMSNSLRPHGNAARQASLSITNSQSLPKLMYIESVMPSNHLILCCALLLPPSIFPSIRVFSNESAFHIRWPKYWSFSFYLPVYQKSFHPSFLMLCSIPLCGCAIYFFNIGFFGPFLLPT